MQNWRHGEYLRTLPARECRACGDPFTAGEFRIAADVSALFRRTFDEKEPGVKAPRAEWRSYPASGESEIACVQMKLVMLEQRGPGHARRLQIIKQGSALALG
jgi:hypothetical protein